MSKYLAVDLGAESGRVILGTLEDERISIEEIHRFPNLQIKESDHTYWNLPSLFIEVKKGLSIAVQKGHADIQSIGIDTWGVDFGLIDCGGKLLELPHTYRDNRTNEIPEKVFEKISFEEIYESTGIQFMQINSLYQLYSVKLYNPSLLERCEDLLFMPDLFNYLLTGNKAVEYTIASTSQFLNAQTKSFESKIFTALDLPIEIMKPVIYPGNIIGRLLPEISEETGLGQIDVVAVGSHDTASAVASVPAIGNGWAYLSSGTWSLLGIEINEPIINKNIGYEFTNEGGVFGTITYLRNIAGLWFLQEIKKSWEKNGKEFSYEDISNMAKEVKEFSFAIDVDDNSFINPEDMIEAVNEFCRNTKQKIPNSEGEYIHSILGSLALKYRIVLKNVEKISGRSINNVHVVGGGSQNELLNQLTANATGKTVLAGPVEATAIGNILVQAISKGEIESFGKGREIVSKSFPLKGYVPNNEYDWDKLEERFYSIST